MNNELLIIDGEKAYRVGRSDHKAERGEFYLSPSGSHVYPGGSAGERHILEPTDNPYILREDVEALRSAAENLAPARKLNSDSCMVSSEALNEIAAALEPFTQPSPPEVQERYYADGNQVRQRIPDGEEFLDSLVCSCRENEKAPEIAAALNANELSKEGSDGV